MWMRALRVWALICLAMVANGAVRAFVLEPVLGSRSAEWVAAATGIGLILAISRHFLQTMNFATVPECLELAGLWTALTVGFEVAFGWFVVGAGWTSLLLNYDLAHGHPWPLVVAAIAAAPFVARPHRPARLTLRHAH